MFTFFNRHGVLLKTAGKSSEEGKPKMKSSWIWAAVTLILSGGVFSGDNGGITGTWEYYYSGLFSDYPSYTKTYVFSRSGEVSFTYQWGDALADSFSGIWVLRNDSLIINRQSCSGLDSSGMRILTACSSPPPNDEAVYWDGNRIYGLNEDNQMRQYYDRM